MKILKWPKKFWKKAILCLKSVYHNIELQEDFWLYFSSSWEFAKYFQFNVLVLRDAEAPYVCTKILRQPVKH